MASITALTIFLGYFSLSLSRSQLLIVSPVLGSSKCPSRQVSYDLFDSPSVQRRFAQFRMDSRSPIHWDLDLFCPCCCICWHLINVHHLLAWATGAWDTEPAAAAGLDLHVRCGQRERKELWLGSGKKWAPKEEAFHGLEIPITRQINEFKNEIRVAHGLWVWLSKGGSAWHTNYRNYKYILKGKEYLYKLILQVSAFIYQSPSQVSCKIHPIFSHKRPQTSLQPKWNNKKMKNKKTTKKKETLRETV